MSKTSWQVKKRYNDKTYKHYSLYLRYDTDSKIIQQIEDLKKQGIGTTEAIKQLLTNK